VAYCGGLPHSLFYTVTETDSKDNNEGFHSNSSITVPAPAYQHLLIFSFISHVHCLVVVCQPFIKVLLTYLLIVKCIFISAFLLHPQRSLATFVSDSIPTGLSPSRCSSLLHQIRNSNWHSGLRRPVAAEQSEVGFKIHGSRSSPVGPQPRACSVITVTLCDSLSAYGAN